VYLLDKKHGKGPKKPRGEKNQKLRKRGVDRKKKGKEDRKHEEGRIRGGGVFSSSKNSNTVKSVGECGGGETRGKTGVQTK